ncbi:MAG: adenylate/guanylate cyclase domain-containing protein [Chlamydiota bacterium]
MVGIDSNSSGLPETLKGLGIISLEDEANPGLRVSGLNLFEFDPEPPSQNLPEIDLIGPAEEHERRDSIGNSSEWPQGDLWKEVSPRTQQEVSQLASSVEDGSHPLTEGSLTQRLSKDKRASFSQTPRGLICVMEDILPESIDDEREVGQTIQAYCQGRASRAPSNAYSVSLKDVGIMIIDIKGSTELCCQIGDKDYCRLKHRLFNRFKEQAKKRGVDINKSLGDGLEAVSGYPFFDRDGNYVQYRPKKHCRNLVMLAREMLQIAKSCQDHYNRSSENEIQLDLRIGLHFGNVRGFIAGQQPFDLEGVDMGVTADLEADALEGTIHISEELKQQLPEDCCKTSTRNSTNPTTYDIIVDDLSRDQHHEINSRAMGEQPLEVYDEPEVDVLRKALEAALNNPMDCAVELHDITIIFVKFAGFSELCHQISENSSYVIKRDLLSYFDDLCKEYGVFPLKALDHGYMACGVSAAEAIALAQAMFVCTRDYVERYNINSLQRPPIDLDLKVGINTGDVIASTRDVNGTEVNRAARLMAIADSETICISRATYEKWEPSSGSRLQFSEGAPVSLKGYKEPITPLYGKVAKPQPACIIKV